LGLKQARLEDVCHAGEAQFTQRLVEFDEIHAGVSCSAVDQIAVDGQFADERVDLAQ